MSSPPFDPTLDTTAIELSSATPTTATTGVIAPAGNNIPEPVPEPDRVAGYKRGSSRVRVVNDKSSKLHTADWAPPITVMDLQPPFQVALRRKTSSRSYVSTLPCQNQQGRMFLPAGAAVQAASYWQSYSQGPATAPGDAGVQSGLQQDPLIDHPLPMDMSEDNVVGGSSGAMQDPDLHQSFVQMQPPVPVSDRQGSVPPHGATRALVLTPAQLQSQTQQPTPVAQPNLPARQGSAPPQGSFSQTAPQFRQAQQGVAPPQQSAPVGDRQGSVPPHGASHAFIPTPAQLQQQVFQSQTQQPTNTVQQVTALGVAPQQPMSFAAHPGYVPPNGPFSQTAPQFWQVRQQGVAPPQQSGPVGDRQGSVPPHGATHALVPTPAQLQQPGFQSQLQSNFAAREGSAPPQGSFQTASQFRQVQQGVAPSQQSAPVGDRQGSVPPHGASHAFIPTPAPLQQQVFQSQTQQPTNTVQQVTALGVAPQQPMSFAAHPGYVPPNGPFSQTAPQFWQVRQQGVAPPQHPAPVGDRRGSVPPPGATHALVPTPAQLQQPGFQSQSQQPTPVAQQVIAQGVAPPALPPPPNPTPLSNLEASLAALHSLTLPPPPSHDLFSQSSTLPVKEQRQRPTPFWEHPGHASSPFENFRFTSSSTKMPPKSNRRITGRSTSSREPTPSNPQPPQPPADKECIPS